ncbi:retention module-containing protein [Vibrio cyclitrophicus]
MDIEVSRQAAVVEAMSGDVVVVKPDGSARKVSVGDTIRANEIVITSNGSEVLLGVQNAAIPVGENCVGCVDNNVAWAEVPIAGEVNFDSEQADAGTFTDDDLAAIQDAILGGADPTQILEATAAGGGLGSANAGFVTIDYNYTQTQPTTFFETTGLDDEVTEEPREEFRSITRSSGGQSISGVLTEGSISDNTYPQSITSTETIIAGSLALAPDSFTPETLSLASLLSELNSDITSSGQPVTFTYDAVTNSIVGVQGSDEVLRIDIEAVSVGNNIELSLITTISQPIDHVPSVGGGQVSYTGDQIDIAFDIQGEDSAGNPLATLVNAQVSVFDGIDPSVESVNITNVETSSTAIEGAFSNIGSDNLQSAVFDASALEQFDGLLSDNQNTLARLSDDGTTITLSIQGRGEVVLTISLDTDGTYKFEQFKPIEEVGSDTLSFALPITVTDFDQDVIQNIINIAITDGDSPVITNIDSIDVDESGVVGGSQEGTATVSGSGSVTADIFDSDIIDHYELEPTEFNTDGSLTSNGEAVLLELIDQTNGVRTYEGYVEVNGSRITVFDVKVDSPSLGNYEFTLYEELSHQGAEDVLLTFALPIYAVDADGDRSALSGGSNTPEAAEILVNVKDDVVELIDKVESVTEPTLAGDTIVSYNLFSFEGADGSTIQSFNYDGVDYSLDQSLLPDATQTFSFTEGVVTISLNGDFSFEVARDIDHSSSETIVKQFSFLAEDGDGDIDTSSLELSITDGQNPAIDLIPPVTLSETDVADGSAPSGSAVSATETITFTAGSDDVASFRIEPTEFNVGGALTSNGFAVEIKEDSANPGTYIGFITDGSNTEIPVFAISFSTTTLGEYSFTLLEALDHVDGLDNNDLSFELPVYAVDSDGDDSLVSQLNVTIGDDVQIMQDGTLDIVEPNLADGTITTNTIDVMPNQSADGATITQFTYDGVVNTLDQSISGEQQFSFTEGELFITLEGEVRFEPNRDLDHSASEDIVKSIVVTSSDFDNDPVTSTITLTITDGDNPIINTVPSVLLEEADLIDGSSPSGSAVSSTQTITFTNQSDDVVRFRIEPTEFNTNDDLKSNGLAVELREDPVGSGDYIGFTTSATNIETTVFTLSFNSGALGEYTFTLIEALDHQDARGNNELSFDLPVYAVDSDGDDSLMSSLSVTIGDDVQIMQDGTLDIVEPNLADGTVTTSIFDVMPNQSADGVTVTQFTYDGQLRTLDQNDNGEQQFSFTEGELFITLQGEVRFEPNRNLNHTLNEDIVKSIVVTSSDSDNDVVTSTVTLTITDGDIPAIDNVPTVTLSETNLSDGSAPSGSAVSSTQTITYTTQSDDVTSFRIEPTEFNVGGALTSNGLAVELKADPATPGGYIGYVTDGSNVETNVFTISFSDTNLGQYTFTLIEAVDHVDGLANNDLSFDLPVYAVDSDGDDSLVSQLNVTIGDDVQIMQGGTLDITEPNIADGTITTNTIDVMPEQSADGATITQFTYDGQVRTLDQTDNGEQQFSFSEGELFITLQGDVRFEPNRNLDHTVNEDIVKSIVVTSSDSDNDVLTSTVTLTITDGDIPTIDAVPSVTLSETNLSDGSAPSGSAVSQTETITFTNQSDDVASFRIEPTEFNVGGALTSNGFAVEIKEDSANPGTYIGFITDSLNTEVPVFTIAFSTGTLGEYTFTLLEALDHVDGLDNNDLSFELPVYAVDSDGDDSLVSQLNVTIGDDVQIMQDGTLDIVEPNLADGTITTNTIDVMPNQSADGATITQFTYDGVVNTLDQSISGEQQFSFTEGELYITLEGEVRFEPNRDLDHSVSEDIVKSIVVTSSDFDNDSLTSTITLTITDGDKPTIDVIPSVTLSETNLTDGSAPSGSAVSSTQTITFTNQSDDVFRFRIEPTEFNTNDDLKSNGLAVELREDPAGSGDYIGFTTSATNVETTVFTLSFSSTTLGEYTFTLLEALDHQNARGNNDLSFDLPVYAVDSDGDDSLMSPLSVTIGDDVQIMQDDTLDIVEPTVADLAAGTVTTSTIDVMPNQSADGATITQFTYDGQLRTLDPNDNGEQQFSFTEGELFITLQGDVRFEPNRNLDHALNEDIVKLIVVTSSDSDNDVLTSTVTLTITDGDIPTIDAVPSVTLSETNLNDGSAPSGSAVSQTETITYTNQSDDVTGFRIEPTEFNTGGTLKSNGLVVELKADPTTPGGYIGYVTDGSSVETNVFTISFSDTNLGQYTFTLLEALDHADGLLNNNLNFDLPVYAVDSDGDDSLVSQLNVTIGDDVQIMQGGVLDITEPNLADGTITTNTIDVMPEQSADGATITQFTYDGQVRTLDQTDNGEQQFSFSEGELFITLQGDVRFEPNRNLDHTVNEDIVKSVVVTSSDSDNDVLTSTVTLTITDGDIPTIEAVPSVTLSETNLSDGSAPSGSAVSQTETITFTNQSDDVASFRIEPTEFNVGGALTSNGFAVEIKEDSANPGTYIGFITDSLNTEVPVFTIAFSTGTLGEYTFTLLEALDHVDGLDNNDLSFDLPVYAVDSDGDDSLVSQLNVTIGDDVQIVQDGTLDIIEPNLADGTVTTSTIDVMPNQSADGATVTQFTYDGQLRTLDQNDTGEQQFSFTEGKLYITLEGEVRFEPNRDLDHSVSEDIVKSIVVTSSDFDNDSLTSTITLTITDGDNPTIDVIPSVTLSETNLTDGSAPSGSAVSSTQTITFTNQSDDVVRFRIEPTEFNTNDDLKSNGLAVELREDPAGSGDYIGFTTSATNIETTVFTLSFNSGALGEYTFTLIEALDHQDARGNNDLSFDLPVYAVDSDGDDSLMSPLNVTIGDDVQIMQDGTLDIVEPNLADGTVTTSIFDVMPNQSADGATVTQFTYDGQLRALDQNDTGEQQFSFTEGELFITLEGEVRFEPNRNLDHTLNEDIVKSIVVTSSDSDNDALTSTVTLTITDGDIPTIDNVPTVNLSETNLSDGSAPSGSAVSSTQTITYTTQSDDVTSFRIEPTEFNVGGALTSNGLAVDLKADPTTPGGYIGYVTDGSNVETSVFTISFSDTNLGQYTFTSLEALDHVDGLTNNDLSFDLPFYAVDSDGDDSLVSQLNVTIGDDVQIMQGGTLDITEPNLADGTITTNTIDVMPEQSADGATITQFTYDGQVRTLDQTDNGEQQFSFTEGELFITIEGEVRFEPNRNLDHTVNEDIVKSIVVTSSDSDNDVLTSTVTLTITDGDIPTIDAVPSVTLSETNLSDGSAPSGSAVSQTETITFINQSDDVANFRIEPTEFNVGGALKSNGSAVEIKEDSANPGTYIGFITDGSNAEVPVFNISFSTSTLGEYTFTLLEALDHADGLDNNDLSFDLPVYAVDTDGDDSLVSQLNVTIGDDVQIMQDGTLDITEPNLADGTITTNTIDVMPNQSADGATITQFTYDGAVNTLDQSISGEQQFSFTEGELYITLEGEVRFEPNRDLDHSVSEDIVKSIVVTSSDFDNDSLTSTVTLIITDGDNPTIDAVPSVSLEEANLADGSTPTGSAVSQTETITFTNQSDDVEKFRLEPSEFNTNNALKSDGLIIEIREEPTGSGNYIGFTTDISNVETTVFTLDFSSTTLGEYTFTLLEAIDHTPIQGNNDLTFNLPVYAVDSDGDDSVMSPLAVTITDDIQVMVNDSLTIEEPTVADLAAGTPTTPIVNVLDEEGADGTTITQFTYDGGAVLTLDQNDTGEQKFVVADGSLYITLQGDIRFEPSRNLDHTGGDIVKSIVVTSSDSDSDLVSSTVTLTITDGDIPTIDTVPSVTLSETNLSDGSAPNASAVSSTQTITFTNQSDDVTSFRIEPTEFNIGGALTSNGLAVELKADPTTPGGYIGFVTTAPNVETNVFTISFSDTNLGQYTFTLLEALDHVDGLAKNDLTFDLPVYAVDSDGDDSLVSQLNVTIGDDVQIMQGGTLDITEPNLADGTITTNTIDVMPEQSADGATITQFTYDGQVRTLDQNDNGEQQFSFTEGELFITLQGDVRFEPNRNLDHTLSEDIVKSIVVTSSDLDNDVVTSTVTLTITDGDIPTIDAVPSVTLSETNLVDGSLPSGSAVSQTETITFTNQSDDVVSFRIEPTEFNAGGVLKSNGFAVEIKEDSANPGTYIGFIIDGSNTEVPVFTIGFSTTTLGEYTFTLLETLDHVDGLDNNDLSFELPVYAVDSDGDDSLVSQLNVTIGDDVQMMQDGTLDIVEPNLADGTITTNTIDVMPNQSADGATITQFTYDGVVNTLDQSISGEQQFSFTEGELFITLEGEVRFEPNRDLDHSVSEDIVKSIVVTSSDFDNDPVTSTITLTITDGDIPTIDAVPSVTLSETNLADGSAPSGSAVSQTETITFTNQSDDVVRFRLEPTEFNTNDALKSNGLAVELREDPQGSGQYIGFTTSSSNVETTVFTLDFNSGTLGEYTFTLIEALDHQDARGNNDLSFNLPVYAVDSDGDDSLVSQLGVTIGDDVQIMQNGKLGIVEPNLANGTVTTSIFDVMPNQSADGATVTQFTYDGQLRTLDQNENGEQQFSFTEGELFITLQGEVRFEPNRDLDHRLNEDIVKSIVVTSSDSDNDVLTSTVTLTITDGDIPTIDTVPSVTLSETNLSDGSDPNASAVSSTQTITFTNQSDDVTSFRIEPTEFNVGGALTSNGLAVELKPDPTTSGGYIGFVTTAPNVETNVFTISFSDTNLGQYTFTLLEALDHVDGLAKNDLTFDLPVYAIDSDGDDSLVSQLKVTIGDDVQVMQDQALNIIEPTVADLAAGTPTTATVDVMPEQSADGATITQFIYDNGAVITLDQNDTGEQKFVFAEGSLFITLQGEVRFEPNRNLNHTASENIVKSIVVTSGDSDNDVVTSTVTLTITDGDIPTIDAVPSVTLSETNLADGSTPSGSAVSQTETITFTNQSDDVTSFRIEPTEFNVGGALKSNGFAVEIKEDSANPGTYIGFITNGSNAEVPVFTISFSTSSLGEYTFTLLEALDHADGLDNNNLSFDLPVYAVDSDGDDSLVSQLNVTIGDDVQIMQDGTLDITEPNLADGTITTSTIDVMPNQSADGATITQFTYDGAVNTLDQSIVGEQQFSFTEGDLFITLQGQVRFEPNRDLDHSVSEDIVKSIVVTSSDFDNDPVTSTITLTITDGDIPTIDAVPSVTLSETNLADGSAPNAGAISSTQTITFTNQSDDVVRFRIEPTEFNTNDALKSNGLAVELREDPQGSGNYIGFTTSSSNVETTVFTLDFNSATLGEYTFTLIEALDHQDARGNNDLSFNLPVYAVDSDGDDSLVSQLGVTIGDDVQLMLGGTITSREPASAVETSNTLDVMPSQSADGAKITSFVFDGNTAESLDLNVNGEQEFVFTEGSVFITTEGEIRFEPVRNQNHAGGDITKSIEVTSVDLDGDIVTSTVTLKIVDGDLPTIDLVPGITLSEVDLVDGSVPTGNPVTMTQTITYTAGSDDVSHFRIDPTQFNTSGSLKSNGLDVEIKEQPANSGNYIGFVKDGSNVETNVFTISFSTSNLGQYTFTLLEALDHVDGLQNNILSFDVPVLAVDADGDDSAMSPMTVAITDDVQGVQDGTLSITEPSLADLAAGTPPTTPIIDVMPTQSADGAKVTRFTYDGGTAVTLDPSISTEQVFTVTDGLLYITIEGEVRFEPSRDLDHSSGDIVRTIVVTTSDFDNDTDTADVTLTIKDGIDPVIDVVPDVNLSEVNLADGSTPTGSPVSSTHTITYTEGSDDFSHFRIATNEFNPGDLLKSSGLVVQLKEDPASAGDYIGYTDDGMGNVTDVFTISFDSANKAQFTFTLIEALDHLDGVLYNDLTFRLPIYAVDTDDSESTKRDVVVTLEDDIQQMQDGFLIITEPNTGTPTTGIVDVMPIPSADGATITQFTYDGSSPITLNQSISGEQEFVFTEGSLYVTLDGDVRFESNRNLDHSAGDIVKSIVFTSSDFDNDIFSSKVTLTIVDGDGPTIDVVPGVALSESLLADGSTPSVNPVSITQTITSLASSDDIAEIVVEVGLFNTNGALKSDGLSLSLREDPANSGDYIAFTTNGSGVEKVIFTLDFDDTNPSQYTFTLLERLDHVDGLGNNDLSFDLSVYAEDTDGDISASKPLTVTITDDVQLMQSGTLSITEPTTGTPTTTTFDVMPAQSADGATITKFVYDNQAETALVQTNTGEQEFVFTEGSLFINLEGDVRFEPNRNLDHSGGNIVKTITVTSEDKDGDIVTSTVTLTISDGAPPVIDTVPTVALEEANLIDGSSPSLPVSQTETITFTAGSDDVSYFRIDTTQFNTSGDLKADGLVVQLKEDPLNSDNYIGYVESGGVQTDIFTITFSSVVLGEYTFTLLEELDHLPVQGNNDQVFTLPVIAVDKDNTDSAMKPLTVTITDDVPTITDTTVASTFVVDEDDLGTLAQATGSFVTTQGADQVEVYELRNIATLEPTLTSSGEAISITEISGAANTTTYQGTTTSGTPIFTLALGNDGSYTFTLLGPLDHEPRSEARNKLLISFDVVAVDSDGDDSNQYQLPIQVIDDVPEMTPPTGETVVDEDDLTGIGSDQSEDTVINGLFTVDEGADGVVKYELVDEDLVLTGLTSDGENLEWLPVSISGSTFTYVAQTVTSNEAVFEIIFDTSDNSYQFELFKPLKHPDGADENNIELGFSVVAEDFDQDQSNAINLTITVTDDVPLVITQSITRIEGQNYNGSKVDMFADATDVGSDGAVLSKIEAFDGSGIVFRAENSGPYSSDFDLNIGSQQVRVYEQTDDGNGGVDTRQLGRLRINSNGEVEFRANGYLDHDGLDTIDFSINVIATDGDLDTSETPLDITITDRDSTRIALKVTTFEDAGRDLTIPYATGDEPILENVQDNQNGLPNAPAQVALQVSLYDQDNAESIGQLTIKSPNGGDSHQGTFYYFDGADYIELVPESNGSIIFGSPELEQSFAPNPSEPRQTIATIDNLFFVPDQHASSDETGGRVRYELEIEKNGSTDHTINSNFRIEIEAVADIATWDDSNSTYHYQVNEDEDNVTLQLNAESQDNSNTETITYELEAVQGDGKFELLDKNGNVLTLTTDGVYEIAAEDINSTVVNPIDNFSGQIEFKAIAVTKETLNPYEDTANGGANDKTQARSVEQNIIIDVTADADPGKFSVSRIKINEDNIDDPDYIGPLDNKDAFTLDEVITMTGSVDTDGSEELFVRISNITEGAVLYFVGTTTVVPTVNGTNYQEIAYSDLANVEVVPTKHSNVDFTFDVTGVVKDTANLSTNPQQVDEEILGTKTVNVEVKGVADVPYGGTNGTDWISITDGTASGVQTTIQESQNGDSFAELDFTVLSGERKPDDLADSPLIGDGSEAITVILSGIPDGVILEDGDGTVIDLNFVGYETGSGGSPDLSKPIYEANITDAGKTSGIRIRPVDSSTENIHIQGKIVVTENDGHTLTFDQEIRVLVEPVIDTSTNYVNATNGNEDSVINIDWHPDGADYIDSDEHFTSIIISGIPSGVTAVVNGDVTVVDDGAGTLTITPKDSNQTPEQFTQIALANNFIQMTPPSDSSVDFTLTTEVEVEERDHEYVDSSDSGEGIATATVMGTINVVVRRL